MMPCYQEENTFMTNMSPKGPLNITYTNRSSSMFELKEKEENNP